MFDELLRSVEEMDAIAAGKRTLENREQGRRHPAGPARALLRILDADPKRAVEALYNR